MSNYRVGRTKHGDVRIELYNSLTNIWHGFAISDDEARGLADALRKAVGPTAGELTLDNSTEP